MVRQAYNFLNLVYCQFQWCKFVTQKKFVRVPRWTTDINSIKNKPTMISIQNLRFNFHRFVLERNVNYKADDNGTQTSKYILRGIIENY